MITSWSGAVHVTGRVAGKAASNITPPSDKALGESLGESLLGELFGVRQSSGRVARRVTAGKVARQVSCLVRESLNISLGESLKELLPYIDPSSLSMFRPSLP
jgi:hypothetical protein